MFGNRGKFGEYAIIYMHLDLGGWTLIEVFKHKHVVGRDSALVESITFNRRVGGSTPALAVT